MLLPTCSVAVVAEEGEGVVDGGGSCWALGVVGRSLKINGHMGGWGGKVVALVVEHHGSLGFVLAVASRRRGGKRCMLAGEAVDKLCPIFFMEGFSNPALERAKIVCSDFGNVGK